MHAAHGSSVRHVVVSRLPNPAKFLNLSYVVAVPPKNININLVVALANFLATHARGEKAIIKYSDKRCEDMQEKLSEFLFK